jgi:hypothetical protein
MVMGILETNPGEKPWEKNVDRDMVSTRPGAYLAKAQAGRGVVVQDPAVHKDVEGRLRIGRRRDGKVSWCHRASGCRLNTLCFVVGNSWCARPTKLLTFQKS